MLAKIFSITYDPEKSAFDSGDFEQFCEEHKVMDNQAVFFEEGGKHIWSIYVSYEFKEAKKPRKAKEKLPVLSEAEQQLFEKLRSWRKAEAEKRGFPPFLIARDKQFAEMILKRCRTKKSLEEIRSFGKKRIANYGTDIIKIIKDFFGDEAKS